MDALARSKEGTGTQIQAILNGSDLGQNQGVDGFLNPPLHYAVWFGHYDLAKSLLSKGTSPMETNGANETALHWAALTGRENIVKVVFCQPIPFPLISFHIIAFA
jgi:ankyrin repeat protein